MNLRILVFSDWFVPGFRAGGPIRSVDNLARLLSHYVELYIFTGDRDLNDIQPYEQVALNQWVDYAPGIKVWYATPDEQGRNRIKTEINNIEPHAVYFNSMFSKNFAIVPLMVMRSFPGIKKVLSPRGMLRSSALAFKPLKKKLFLNYARLSGLFRDVHFHATDEQECADVYKNISVYASVTCIGNVPAIPDAELHPVDKQPGQLRIIFTGRIHPIKNLHILLEALKEVKASVACTLVGVMEDEAYWARCAEMVQQLPNNITVAAPVEVPPAALSTLTREHHLFVLPTQGENFGHAIFEALCCGRPALISDQTPWRQLEKKHAGWDVPLNRVEQFTQIIEQVAAMNSEEWGQWCTGAHRLAQTVSANKKIEEQYLNLFS
ncbi:MAG: glycosyltransferase [Dinghuibacter sp.]|nr:glycosyltransferase [Dinghuibacter sp.]